MTFLSGYIGIIGPPNVGKSTLLNRILGRKVAIVSPKPQTTRNRIIGIYHGEGVQMVFVDTPGIHKTRTPLHQSMVASALAVFQEVDILLLMVQLGDIDRVLFFPLLKNLKRVNKPCLLLINKIDKGPREVLLPLMAEYGRRHPFDVIIPISALTGDGVSLLMKELKSRLLPGPPFFPEEMDTDQSEDFLIAEVIREKIYLHLRQELPYACAVGVNRIEDVPDKNLLRISARIYVETESQKGILIGRKGRMIQAVGRSARMDLERIFGVRIYLDLAVSVEKNWTRDTRALRRLGY
ncbi:MAG: GTPase Era [Deltaproteobacteria bacterium]|nr:GTPase Era [Deltaproteobacteria bacterium]